MTMIMIENLYIVIDFALISDYIVCIKNLYKMREILTIASTTITSYNSLILSNGKYNIRQGKLLIFSFSIAINGGHM